MDTTFKLNWEKILHTCSIGLIDLPIGDYTKISSTLDVDIIDLCGKLQKLKAHKSIPNKEQKLKTHLQTFSKEILIKKGHTFLWDKNAFERGKAYKWGLNNKRMFNKRHMQYNQTQPSGKSFSNIPFIPPQAIYQHKSRQSTKRQYYGDSTQGQKAKKPSPDTPQQILQISNQTSGHHPSTSTAQGN